MDAAPEDHPAGHQYAPAGDAGTVALERAGADLTGLVRALGELPAATVRRDGLGQGALPTVLICDRSTLDALIRKVGLLKALDHHPLAGRISALLDGLSRLPVWIRYTEDAQAYDQRFWDDILGRVSAGMLLIFDLGYTNFARFAQMTSAGITFVMHAKDNLAYEVAKVILCSAAVHDRLVWIGITQAGTRQLVRLVEVLYRGKWYRDLSNELDAQRLTAEMLAVYIASAGA